MHDICVTIKKRLFASINFSTDLDRIRRTPWHHLAKLYIKPFSYLFTHDAAYFNDNFLHIIVFNKHVSDILLLYSLYGLLTSVLLSAFK